MLDSKILVTGAKGFVGSHIVNHLKNCGYTDVIELKGKTECDLTNQRFVQYLIDYNKPDIVIHTAARVGGIGANMDNPGLFMYENLIMGANLIETCRKYGKLKKFIMLGTVCSYPKFTPVPFEEEQLWDGYPEETNAPYGVAKKAILEMLIAYNKQYGFNSTTLIPCNMYGPGDHFNLTTSHIIPAIILKVYEAMKTSRDLGITAWGSGEVSREFLYVTDCARAVEHALHVNTGPEPINIGTGEETKIKDIIATIIKLMGHNGLVRYDKSFPDGQPRRSLDISKAKKVLKYQPLVDLETGLEETINWFLESRK